MTTLFDDPEVIVYSLPFCDQCDKTKWHLKKLGIPFREIDLSEDPEARARVKDDYGFMSAPVVVTPDDAWCMYKPEKIKAILG